METRAVAVERFVFFGFCFFLEVLRIESCFGIYILDLDVYPLLPHPLPLLDCGHGRLPLRLVISLCTHSNTPSQTPQPIRCATALLSSPHDVLLVPRILRPGLVRVRLAVRLDIHPRAPAHNERGHAAPEPHQHGAPPHGLGHGRPAVCPRGPAAGVRRLAVAEDDVEAAAPAAVVAVVDWKWWWGGGCLSVDGCVDGGERHHHRTQPQPTAKRQTPRTGGGGGPPRRRTRRCRSASWAGWGTPRSSRPAWCTPRAGGRP